MSRKRQVKTSPDFGKRGGREETPKAERKPTPMQRLAAIGKRWFAGAEPRPSKFAPKMGFRRER